jgi:integrase
MTTWDGGAAARRMRVERGIYRQANGKYAVCFMLDGKPRLRTVGYDLDVARAERRAFIEAARWGVIAAAPRLRFDTVAEWWVGRFARKVATGEGRERTLELHRYHLDRHLLPELGPRLIRHITTADVADLLDRLRDRARSEKTIAGALATLESIMRFAVRNGRIADSPVGKLETDERPRPARRTQRVLGREEIVSLMGAYLPAYRALIATALLTGMRLSELLGLIWDDVDLIRGSVHVRAQLSRARTDAPGRRVAPKTPSAARDIPLAPQLATVLREHRSASPHAGGGWVFATRNGTPLSQRSALTRAARIAGLDRDGSALQFHDLRHTFASHLIIDLHLDVVQVSRILGHASVSTTLDVYAHLFDEARHSADIRARMAGSAFAGLIDPGDERTVIVLPAAVEGGSGHLSAREPGSAGSLDQNLTNAIGENASAAREIDTKQPACRRFAMELAGLEPAASWVRSRRSPN